MVVGGDKGGVNIGQGTVNQHKGVFPYNQLHQLTVGEKIAVGREQNDAHGGGLGDRANQRSLLFRRVVADMDGKGNMVIRTEVTDTGEDTVGVLGHDRGDYQRYPHIPLKNGFQLVRGDVTADKIPPTMDVGDIALLDQFVIGVPNRLPAGIKGDGQHSLAGQLVIGNTGISTDHIQ